MNRTIIIIAAVCSASSLLLVDSAVKGTALLILASVAALILWRDSAATRHLVWLLAIVAMLAVPVLSAMLPQWRVLPKWARTPPATAVVAANQPSITGSAVGAVEMRQVAAPHDVEVPPDAMNQSAVVLPDSPPALVTPHAVPALAARSWRWLNALPFVWAIGFCAMALRLMAARWMLWNTERQGTAIWPSKQPAKATDEPIVTALEAARLQLGISRPVALLIHPEKTIPVVWGILRPRLLLPMAARHWSGEQLRSVLLHELAHVKRRDTLAQLLTQIACTLHWFNPLVWFAAWRLGVERERACDDLVLASGVRPSAYAGHLLEVVTGLAPARWTQSCGLAMARKSSLNGRLVAVLSQKLNRRGVTTALASAALLLGAGIAVPLAMLRAAEPDKPKPDAPAVIPGPKDAESKTTFGQPKAGAPLKPATEQKLKWGEPANGLRMALAWPPSFGEPGMGDAPVFYLVVQNVSQAEVRLTANDDAAANPRTLMMRENGRPLDAISYASPTPGDWLLQPREVAFLRLFSPAEKMKDGNTTSAAEEQAVRMYPQYSLTAEMTIEKAPAGAWTGKLATGESRGSLDVIPPKLKDAQALYKSWTTAARADGRIPGGVIAILAESVKTFIRNNPTWQTTPQLEKMLPRFDGSHDWKAQDAVALLDDLAAAEDTPIGMALEHEEDGIIREGAPLPPELASAPWGKPLANGLRHAWLLEPHAAEYRLGTPLKAHILIHNAGKEPVVFRTRLWHQLGVNATDANGAAIQVDSTYWTTIGKLTPFRLAPGEFIEVNSTGIGVGSNHNDKDWQNTRVGSWIDAKPGDDVTVTSDPVPLSDWNEKPQVDGEPSWWLDHIKARLSRHLPFPADAEARKLLLYRIAMELFGTPVSQEINDAFVADKTPAALDSLAKLLFHRPGQSAWAGPLQSAPTKFHVLPPDPDAAKRPRTANNPGHYTIGENAVLAVTRRPVNERIVNEASIQFASPDPAKAAPAEPHKIELPDGYGTWAAAWVRGSNVLWVMQKGTVRSIDFTNPAEVKETTFEEPASPEKVPKPILDALHAALDVPAAPKPAKEMPPPAAATPGPAADSPK
jgi:beta-lactamase regulating signal transducer with metallopeptidase domain